MKANIIFLLVLLSVLILINCSYYSIIDRIGGDITGFQSLPMTTRYYSSLNNTFFIQIGYDTIINDLTYKRIYFDYSQHEILFWDNWIFERIFFNNTYVNIPYLNTILIENHIFNKTEETINYKYNYYMYIDSIITLSRDSIEYKNVYCVKTKTLLTIGEKDTLIEHEFLLSNNYGIIGIKNNNEFFYIDSIIQ